MNQNNDTDIYLESGDCQAAMVLAFVAFKFELIITEVGTITAYTIINE